jgi:3-methylcrotonyl-CoA carboxylase alpha subunit
VEHTVTEQVTGLDLVEWQLRVAAGERLPLEQDQIRLTGHAIEARVCAEDPERDFLPSAGDLRLLEWPGGRECRGVPHDASPCLPFVGSSERGPDVRVDAGFSTGDRVPESYDSLLGKVVAWAPSRTEAARRLRAALERTHCAGVRTNERWLARILANQRFLEIRHSIAFLEAHGQEIQSSAPPSSVERQAVALAALALQNNASVQAVNSASSTPGVTGASSPWVARDGFTPNLPGIVQLTLQSGGQQRAIEIEALPRGSTTIRVDGVTIAVTEVAHGDRQIAACLDGIRVKARAFVYESHVHIWLGAGHYDCLYEDPRSRQFSASASSGDLTTPLPGVVAAVAVVAGQAVAAGEVLMVIEAMKMEHTITAPYAGTVQSVHFARGDRVPEGSTLLELAAEEK